MITSAQALQAQASDRQRDQAIADALPITHPGSSFGKSTTATRTHYGHDFPASKAATAPARYAYVEVMEHALGGTQATVTVARELARRARNSREAIVQMKDLAMDAKMKPADARFARETARNLEGITYGLEAAVIVALGFRPETIAAADYPAIMEALKA